MATGDARVNDNTEQVTSAQVDQTTQQAARREFLRKVGKAGATAPAVGLLMAASFKSARAIGYEAGGSSTTPPDTGGCGSS